MEASSLHVTWIKKSFYFPQEKKNEVNDVNKASETVCAFEVSPTHYCTGRYISFARISLTIERKKSFICAAKHLSFAQIFYLRFTCCNPSIAQITCNFSISDLRMTARILIVLTFTYVVVLIFHRTSKKMNIVGWAA
jgi:hypothetical protein